MALLWFSSQPQRMTRDAQVPTFWQVMLGRANVDDSLQWKMLDVTVSYEFFSELLRFILVLTVFVSALAIVVVFNDIRLTKK